MKKIALVGATLAMALAASSASAANSLNAGTIGLNVDTNQDFVVNGKYLVSKDMAILGGFGLRMMDSGAANNSKSNDLGFMVGARKYLKSDDFAPFVGGRLAYKSTRDFGTANDVTDMQLYAEVGAEYFVGKQFSVEGRVGFGYQSTKFTPVVGGTSTTASGIGTNAFNLSANFYF